MVYGNVNLWNRDKANDLTQDNVKLHDCKRYKRMVYLCSNEKHIYR
jgi:hypothetical protein